MSSKQFTLPDESYVRNIDPVNHYLDQTSTYLSITTGKNIEECREFVKTKIKDGTFKTIHNPRINYLERGDNGDREYVEGTLLGYINSAVKNEELIAPTLTTYTNTKVKKSLLVAYIDANVKARNVAKKAMFVAKANKDTIKEKIKNIEQTNRKLSNNAISGAHVSKSTPLENKTAHSTLTSNCRSTSGYGNANNEKLLCGNRHYWNGQIALANIISIITHIDYDSLQNVINKYNIVLPTVEDTMECITYSTDLYWMNKSMITSIRELVEKLSPIQRAAFVYTGDLYHLKKFNDSLVKKFIKDLSSKIKEGEEFDYLNYIQKANEDYLNLAHQICYDEMKGMGKNYKALDSVKLKTLALTTKNIDNVLVKYEDLIKVIFVSDNMPASVAYFPESIRRAAITSDTDSTIFTVQDWVSWYKGSVMFDDESTAVASTMIFLAAQSITHLLAKMSANFGIEKERLHQIAMKNEFMFNIFVATNVAKHYYASISCQEGNVFDKNEIEIKGVHLKSSNSPKAITKKASELMENVMTTLQKGEKIKLTEILKEIGDIERSISKSIIEGNLQYFRLGEIKKAESYTKDPEESPYSQYLMWQQVFSEKYGTYSEPPYQTVKVSTTLVNPTVTKLWLDEMKDRCLSEKISKWMEDNNKKVLPNLMLPLQAVNIHGIPPEIAVVINVRKIIYDICKIFYLILETLGFYICNNNMTKLISDSY